MTLYLRAISKFWRGFFSEFYGIKEKKTKMKENKKVKTKLTRKRKKGGDRGKGTSSVRCFFSFFLKVDTLSFEILEVT